FNIKPYQLLWVNPKEILMGRCKVDKHCTQYLKDRFIQDGEWDQDLVNPLEHSIVKTAFNVSNGKTNWKLSGEYSRMNDLISSYNYFDNCNSIDDVEKRYNELDKILSEVKSEKNIKCRKNLRRFNFRELGGMEVAVGRNGEIIKIGDGQHRLGIALAFGIEEVPVSIILVHKKYEK
ncbi:MAG: hypothetical protein HN601_11675, partial [Candidatus Marinimicrobia bacterium]|nr:hypothetical protein [Candidatus Neomarinimicrobiota bacterium]